jgi:hypothetical protein
VLSQYGVCTLDPGFSITDCVSHDAPVTSRAVTAVTVHANFRLPEVRTECSRRSTSRAGPGADKADTKFVSARSRRG